MHDTLPALIERAMGGSERPLEFYLREQSRLPGPRANLELEGEVADLLAGLVIEQPHDVRVLLNYLVRNEKSVISNTPDEFVVMCGVAGFGACAAAQREWRAETLDLLAHYANSTAWRVREGAARAFQRILLVASHKTSEYLIALADRGTYLQQRACVAAVAEPVLLNGPDIIESALKLQRMVLERFHAIPSGERRRDDVRTLRQALGYTLSVVTAATPEKGFALMCECATWEDPDITWILRENLKKRRLAKFRQYTDKVSELLA